MSRSTTLVLGAAALAAPLAVGAQTPDPLPLRAPRIIEYLPPRQAGQWEMIETTSYGAVPSRSQMCIDPTTDADTMEIGLLLLGACPDAKIERVGSEWIVDERCDYATIKQTTKTAISGDFQTTITVRVEIPGRTTS